MRAGRVLALGLALLGPAAARASRVWSIATGNPSGVYYPLGGALASLWSAALPGLSFRAEVTAASVANLTQVARGESEVAFAQGDTLVDAVRGDGRFPHPLPVRALARLYPNLLHLVTLEGSGIERVADLRGRRVSVGAPGSASAVTTRNVLSALGIALADLDARQLSFAETANALRDGLIDAGFITGGIGTAAIVELAYARRIRLVSFSDEEIGRIRARFPAYAPFPIPPGVYRGVDEPVQTPSLWNYLVVHERMDDAIAARLLETLLEGRAVLERASRVARAVTPRSACDTAPVPLHPGARRVCDSLRHGARASRPAPSGPSRRRASRLAASETPCLVLADADTGRPLLRLALRPGEGVVLRYRHSVENVPVEEGIELGEDGRLYVVFSRAPRHGPSHRPRAGRLAPSGERPGWQEASFRLVAEPLVLYTGEAGLGATSLLWRGALVPLARRFPRRHLAWRVEGGCGRAATPAAKAP